jgi:uncharacterized membrane protein
VYWALGLTVFRDTLGTLIRFYNDDFDRLIYSQRGAWAVDGLVPYRGVFSEYPHVATYLFGLPYFFVRDNFVAYLGIFSLVMCLCLFALILLLQRMMPGRESLAYLMLLPAPLYFTTNRFDIVATLFVVLALWCMQRGHGALTGVCLGVATLTKWYPLLLLPLWLSYAYRHDRRQTRAIVIAFALTCGAIVLPSLVGAGIRAVLRPYAFHASRGLELVSLPALLHLYVAQWLGITIPPRVVEILCLAGVVTAVAASVRARVDSIRHVASWSVVILSAAILLSTVWSPQWMLWVMPLMILIARPASDVPWLVAYGIIGYLVFPLIHDALHGLGSIPIRAGTFVVYAILLRTIAVAYQESRGERPVRTAAPAAASS